MSLPRIRIDDLHAAVQRLPAEMRMDPGGRVIGVANTVIAHFFGVDWFTAHIRHDSPRRGFLNLDFGSDRLREASTFRVVELAENLLNLQHIEGFAACIGQMRGGAEKIESTCAELDFGRFLYIHDIDPCKILWRLSKAACRYPGPGFEFCPSIRSSPCECLAPHLPNPPWVVFARFQRGA